MRHMLRAEKVGMEQKDRDLMRKVADRARERGGWTEKDKQELAHLLPVDSRLYDAPDPWEGLSSEEKEEWMQLGREISARNRARRWRA